MTRILFLILLLPYICHAQNAVKVASINPQLNCDPGDYMECNGKLYFSAYDEAHGNELWVTEGTAGSTHIVKDIVPGSQGSFPIPFIVFDNKLFLTAYEGNDRKVWVTDGTEKGTFVLKDDKDINGHKAVIFNNRLFLTGFPGIWVTDGTEAGTKIYADELGLDFRYTLEMVVYDNKLYFTADDANGDNELWVSDGTTAGTYRLLDINPTEDSRISSLIVADNKMFFWAHDVPFKSSKPEYKPYISDGTAAGTKIMFNPTPPAKYGPNFYAFGNKVMLSYSENWNVFCKLYITDGTAAGTIEIHDSLNQHLGEHFLFKDKMFFMANGVHGEEELFVSDGTPQGTHLFDDFNFPQGGEPRSFHVSGDKFYFISENKNTEGFAVHGDNIWVSDGTVNGTYMPEFPGRNMKKPLLFVEDMGMYKSEPYFGARYDDDGMQLWKLDMRFPTGVADTKKNDDVLQVYPNPVADKLFIKNISVAEVEITDMMGRVLLQQPLQAGNSVDVSTLQKGVYILRTGDGSYTRFVKQ